MKSRRAAAVGATLIGAATLAAAGEIDVMAQNQYLGADQVPVLGAVVATLQAGRTAIVFGDLNSDSRETIPRGASTPYQVFAGNGFSDAWTMRPHAGPGFTCCEVEDLWNRWPQFTERIDRIFSMPRPAWVIDMRVPGDRIGDTTHPPGRGGLWPSDHISVAATLKFDR